MDSEEVVTIEKQIRDVLSEQCALDEVEGIDDLQEEHGLDSLDMTDLYVALEEKFGIQIEDDDWDDLKTVQQIAAYVDKKKRQ